MVPNTTTADKPRAYFAHLDERSGVLTKPADEVLFFDTEARTFTTITPANAMRVVVLKEVGAWMSEYYADLATARQERREMRQMAA